ncbi:GNAT family N-acetyltransferase [Candidatus Hydrogenedentota bacterium]
MKEATFRSMQEEDLPGVLDIYNHYIVTTTATFYPFPISMETLKTFIFLDHDWYMAYVIQHMGKTAGFCFLTQFKKHVSYNGTAELGIYLKPEFTRLGLGSQAARHLEKVATANGLRMIVASVSGENTASIELFRKLEYEQCAHFKRIGEKWGRAIDVIFFQRSFENDVTDPRPALGDKVS